MTAAAPGQSSSFSSQVSAPSSSQSAQNTVSNPECGVRKVTIKQLLDAVESRCGLPRFMLNGHGIGKVMVVANVSKTEIAEATPRRITYSFDDGSGKIDGFKWEGVCDPDFDPFDYGHIVGELDRYDGGRRGIKVFHIRPVYDPHEVYYHILSVIVDSVSIERGPPPRGSMDPNTTTTYSRDGNQWENVTRAVGNISISGERGESLVSRTRRSSRTTDPSHSELSPLERDIASCISKLSSAHRVDEDDRNGVHVELIIGEIKSLYPDIDVTDFGHAVESLINQGIITTTIDDFYYALT